MAAHICPNDYCYSTQRANTYIASNRLAEELRDVYARDPVRAVQELVRRTNATVRHNSPPPANTLGPDTLEALNNQLALVSRSLSNVLPVAARRTSPTSTQLATSIPLGYFILLTLNRETRTALMQISLWNIGTSRLGSYDGQVLIQLAAGRTKDDCQCTWKWLGAVRTPTGTVCQRARRVVFYNFIDQPQRAHTSAYESVLAENTRRVQSPFGFDDDLWRHIEDQLKPATPKSRNLVVLDGAVTIESLLNHLQSLKTCAQRQRTTMVPRPTRSITRVATPPVTSPYRVGATPGNLSDRETATELWRAACSPQTRGAFRNTDLHDVARRLNITIPAGIPNDILCHIIGDELAYRRFAVEFNAIQRDVTAVDNEWFQQPRGAPSSANEAERYLDIADAQGAIAEQSDALVTLVTEREVERLRSRIAQEQRGSGNMAERAIMNQLEDLRGRVDIQFTCHYNAACSANHCSLVSCIFFADHFSNLFSFCYLRLFFLFV